MAGGSVGDRVLSMSQLVVDCQLVTKGSFHTLNAVSSWKTLIGESFFSFGLGF